MGRDVPRERRSRKDEMFPANTACATTEKKNADNPNPDMTIPVVVARCQSKIVCSSKVRANTTRITRTALSGKFFAVALMALAKPAFPPAPVIKLQIIRAKKTVEDPAVPESYNCRIPKYPTRSNAKATGRDV